MDTLEKGKSGTWAIQSLRFPKSDGWTMESAKKWASAHPDVAKSTEIEEEDIIMGFDDLEEMVASLKSKLEAELEEQRTMYIEFARKLIEDAIGSFVEKLNAVIEAKKQEEEGIKEEEIGELLGVKKDEIKAEDANEILGVLTAINEEIKRSFKIQL